MYFTMPHTFPTKIRLGVLATSRTSEPGVTGMLAHGGPVCLSTKLIQSGPYQGYDASKDRERCCGESSYSKS